MSPRPGQDHILITGPGKTGTTGLYASVKSGLRAAGFETLSVFEPPNTRKIDNLLCLAPGSPMLVKTTLDAQPKSVPEPRIFDRIVMTVRDPRDMVLSGLLFRPLTVRSMSRTNQAVIDEFVKALETKQVDPAGTSVRELFDLANELRIGSVPFKYMVKDWHTQQAFMSKYSPYVMQYEKFVLGELDDLSDYLGFPVENVSAKSSSMFGHITRSKGSGEFKQWFTAGDLQYFNEMFHECLVEFGYELDVELPSEPVVDPLTGSEYVRNGYVERTKTRGSMTAAGSSSWVASDVATLADFQRLVDFATDGDAMACARVAEVILGGHLGAEAGSRADALQWARWGARLGSVPAMRLTRSLLRRRAGNDAARYREARRWTVEINARNRQHSPEDKAKIVRLEKELAIAKRRAMPTSRGPLATTVKAALKDPKGDGRAALGKVRSRLEAKVKARSSTR